MVGAVARQGGVEHRVAHRPVLGAVDLEDEDVVGVVVRREAGGTGRREVGVGLHRVAELGFELAGRSGVSGGHQRCSDCSTTVAPSANGGEGAGRVDEVVDPHAARCGPAA